ncbi:GNAT family N-acetyltransferase [Brevibacterium album]|uniref:GNAT family N-acetyltransferase n=1 Tax=Brevibacterium album TaxID=417948 RepID=UPI001B7FCD5D|nr:GNAT family N-acetyltransferase [Brevibacterium album]
MPERHAEVEVVRLDSLEPAADLLAEAAAADGIAPLSDGLLEAAARGEALVLALADPASGEEPSSPASAEAPALAGVAVAALQGTRWAAEAVVAPQLRGAGHGRTLVTALADLLAEQGERAWFWSHGDHPAAAHLAAEAGYARARELLQLTTNRLAGTAAEAPAESGGAVAEPGAAAGATASPDDTTAEAAAPLSLPAPQVPEGIVLRSAAPGDAEDWARVNNAAFSWHPEQGGQPVSGYAARLADPAFDRDSVVMAERAADHRLAGFHETKMHSDHPSGLRMGEVYVIAVDPQLHARGLGRALLLEGMRRLADAGAEAIELYVESDNASALPLYRGTGFVRTVTHVSYAPPEA